MRLSRVILSLFAFAIAGALSFLAANYSVNLIEARSEIGVRAALDTEGLVWAEVRADGLQVTLEGEAPTEAKRFQAESAAGTIVDTARVIDAMTVKPHADLAPPDFSIKILRNDAGISVIGLVPAVENRARLAARFAEIAGDTPVTDLLERANFEVPDGWRLALEFALTSMDQLPRAKLEVDPGRVHITAITESPEQRETLEASLREAVPDDLEVVLSLSAPRPVLTPFTLRFVLDQEGARFDACSADTDVARDRIVAAAKQTGADANELCVVGMGVPSPNWAEAAELAIASVAELGGGSVTFSDADISLVALEGTDETLFDRAVGELENALPEVFALKAVLPKPVEQGDGPPEFVATLSPEGVVLLRGRIESEESRNLATSYAQSLFGSRAVTSSARIVEDLPADWFTRILTGLESLGNLEHGAVTILPDAVSVRGVTYDADANTRIAQLLASKLGGAQRFDIEVRYEEQAAPVFEARTVVPSSEECEGRVRAVIAEQKIGFDPGSTNISAATIKTVDAIADVMKECASLDLKWEIKGHTDSQGSEAMNLALSEARARSVLNALQARRVPSRNIVSTGYGETTPIADNDTSEGREANRRIEVVLINDEGIVAGADESVDAESSDDAPQDIEDTEDEEAANE